MFSVLSQNEEDQELYVTCVAAPEDRININQTIMLPFFSIFNIRKKTKLHGTRWRTQTCEAEIFVTVSYTSSNPSGLMLHHGKSSSDPSLMGWEKSTRSGASSTSIMHAASIFCCCSLLVLHISQLKQSGSGHRFAPGPRSRWTCDVRNSCAILNPEQDRTIWWLFL